MRNDEAKFVFAALLLVASAGGCRTPASTSPTGDSASNTDASPRRHHPILLIGLDGVEWAVVLEMLHQDRLPTIAALMQRGAYGRMSTTKPTLSPVIWTSIATGMTAGKHGIRHFIHKQEEEIDGIKRLYTSMDRKTKAFWNRRRCVPGGRNRKHRFHEHFGPDN